jgi:RimJ/RimL family protein N-acetyltransferase
VQKFPLEDLKYVIFHKSIWPVIWGDMAPDPETIDFEKALKDPNFQFWLVYFDDRPVGYHCAGNENNIYWKVQTGFLPEARGKGALLSAKVAIFELFNKYGAKKLVAEIAEDNLPSQQFIKLCGFKEEGLNSKAFMRNGVLLDLIRYAKWG